MFKVIVLIFLLVRVNISQVQVENINCANGANEGVFFPHPESCQSYLTCFLGQLIEGQCGYGLFFDLERQICEAESRVRCVMPSKSAK
ncbi:AAEL010307-PA [Aedes aegypti]|uniref:AAEL010307-PA n=1 Tax=Aedes aegypti TaxID=7159 RepID=Q0IEI0_AEDAE|nr:AAEL010307-PA [Aedes aegypti]